VPLPTPSIQTQDGGLAFAPGGSATNNAMSIPTAPTCFRSRGGHLIIGRTAILWQLLSLSLSLLSPTLLPLLSLLHVTIAVTIAITIVAGCCHCNQDNKFLTVFVMLHVFLQPQTSDRQGHLHHWTEGDGLGKPKAWEIAPRLT
jgi:hypothetical protein